MAQEFEKISFQKSHKNTLTFFFCRESTNVNQSDRERILKERISDKRSYEREYSFKERAKSRSEEIH